MRLLVLGDSLGLPRPQNIKKYFPHKEGLAVSYEETYASILSKKINSEIENLPLTEVINRSIRFSTIKDIHRDFFDHLFYFQPDIITLQVGIVDCWYREDNDFKQLVDLEEFKIHLKSICELLEYSSCKLIIIGICPSSLEIYNRYRGIEQEIKNYNEVLKAAANNQNIFYIDIEKQIESNNVHLYLLSDGVHLSKLGNKLVANECIKIINGINKDVKVNIKKFNKRDIASEIGNNHRKKYIFGSGKSGRELKKIFESNGIEIVGFVDNDITKKGMIIDNIPVYDFNKLNNENDSPFIIISSTYFMEIVRQLNAENYQYEQDFLYHFYYNEDFSLII